MTEYRAYYFTLHATGVPEIDAILEAIAAAGKSYHHTADWGDGVIGDAPSVVQPIQEAANRAAEAARREPAPPTEQSAFEIACKLQDNAAFFRCCALSGEVPRDGAEPYPEACDLLTKWARGYADDRS